MNDLQPGENPFAQKEIESGVNPFEIPEGQNPFETSSGSSSLLESIANNPYVKKANEFAMLPIAGTEVAMNVASSVPATIAGVGNMVVQPVLNYINDKPQTSAEENFFSGMEAGTYQPTSKMGKQFTENVTMPLVNDYLLPLAPMMGGFHINTPTVESLPKEVIPKVENKINLPIESKLIENNIKQVNTQINSVMDTFNKLTDSGKFDESTVAVLQGLEERLNKLTKTKEELESIARGEVESPNVAGDVRKQELIKQLKERNPTKQLGEPSIEDVSHIDELLRKQPIPEEIPVINSENGLDTITIPEAVEPKVTPFEVALQKITEAKNMVPEELQDRIQTTQERINMLGDDPRTSSLRENLVAELSAYEDIKAGREPDMSWFEGTKPLEQIESINIEPPTPKLDSIQDILINGGDITGNFDKAPHLFTNDGLSSTKFDRAFSETAQGREFRKITQHFINQVGLNKDNIYVVLDDVMSNKEGRGILADANHYNNDSVIRISRRRINESISDADLHEVSFGSLTGQRLETAKQTFMQVRVASHEVGHILLNRYLQSTIKSTENLDGFVKKFNDYKATNKAEPVSMFDFRIGGNKRILENQASFHEFFAEQTTKVLLHEHTLGAFSKGISKVFSKLIDASIELLRKAGVDVKRPNFASKLVNDIISANKKTIADTGETIFEYMERKNNDLVLRGKESRLFQDKTLNDVLDVAREKGMLLKDNPFMGLDLKDIPTVSVRLIQALSDGTAVLSRKFFGKMNQSEFNMKDPHVTSAYWKMKDIDLQTEQIVNRLWYGDVKPKDIKWHNTFSKVRNADSPYVALAKSTPKDKFVLHELFQKGFEDGLSYEDNLTKNGNHLTPDQVKYYNTLSKLFTKMYEESVKIQEGLDKKHILPQRAGWYPSVRSGKYAVSINYGDIVSHVENFNTKLMAEKFKAKMEQQGLKHHIVSEVMDMTDQQFQPNAEMASIIRDILAQKLPSAKDFIENETQRLLDSMSSRGGKLGQHHEYRLNISGSKGSEFFKTPEELGKSFGEAIEQSIAEKGMQLKQLMYKTNFDPLLTNEQFKSQKPNSHAVIQQMYDSSLGRNKNVFSSVGKEIDYVSDLFADGVMKALGSEKVSDISLGKITENTIKEAFYFLKMMPKLTFSVIGQFLTIPAGTVSHMSYGGHGLMAYKSFSKGILKLVSGDAELWNSIKDVSQRTNTFEPQFVESLSLKDAGHPMYKGIKDWLLLQAPGKASEAASRIGTYAILRTHYIDLGKSVVEAEKLAIDGTGKILNLYDRANSAPIFDHTGAIGDMIKPLQGFGQNMLGKILAMGKHINPIDYKTWGPLVNFTLLTVATTGVMGLPFIQEYEKFRRWANKNFNDYSLPSILDIFAKDDSFLDRVVPMNDENRAIAMYGLPSLSGFDLSSSARSNETLPSLILGVMAGYEDPNTVVPLYEWAKQVPGAAITMGQAVAGQAGVADTAKAIDVLAPAGHLGYGIKEVAGVNKTNIFGKETNQKIVGKEAQANGERTGMDIAAGILGTKTTKQRMNDAIQFQVAEDEKNLTAKKDRLGVRFTETGDIKYVKQMAELGMTSKEIQDKIGLEVYNRVVPQSIRLMANKNGKIQKGKGQRAAVGLFNFRGN